MIRPYFPESQETGSKIVVLLIIFLVIVVTLVLICLCRRKCCNSNSAERNQSAPTNVPDGLVPEEELPPPEPPAPQPTNPTLIRLDSIPTYSECITASDRVVSNNDYVSLPTEEELNELPGVAPPSYEEVQEHGELYGEVTMATTAV